MFSDIIWFSSEVIPCDSIEYLLVTLLLPYRLLGLPVMKFVTVIFPSWFYPP